MSDRHTVRSLAALAVVLAVAVSGCTDTARPKPLPSASPSPTNSASETPTPPTMPPEASGTSAKSAEAFVRYYVAAVNFALKTGQIMTLRAASAPGCSSCASVAGSIADVYEKGDRLTGKGWTIRAITPVPNQPQRSPILQTAIYVNPQSKVFGTGAPPELRPGGRKLMIFTLARVEDRWVIDRWEQSS